MMVERELKVYFLKEYRWFINKDNKKQKSDYVLNINKIIKDKFDEPVYILNAIQSFILNYEIKKLLDKVIKISNQKYDTIIYVNNNLSASNVLNIVGFLNGTYKNINFQYNLINKNEDYEPTELAELKEAQVQITEE